MDACARALESSHALSVRRAVQALDSELAARIGLDRYYAVEVPDEARLLAQVLTEFDEMFEVVEVDVPVQAALGLNSPPPEGTADALVNDPMFDQQWSLENTGQLIRGVWGTPGADVGAFAAWTYTRGRHDVVVAVLDSGISLSHPELVGQLVEGINLTSTNAADVDDPWVSHGTFISGIIAARQGNQEGISGLAPGCRIMPVRIINRFNWTLEQWLAQGVVWATDHGASVLNISLGFPSATAMQRDAIRYAFERDVVICASSGNIATDPIGFPARLDETIAVGATDNRDGVTSFTSTGPALTLCAPGRDIISTWDTGSTPDTYVVQSGTSFAVPHVAAAAALVRSLNPRLTGPQVRRVLSVTCRDLGSPGRDHQSGWGRLDVPAALELALSYPVGVDATCASDFNGDGHVDFLDLQIFLEAFADGERLGDWNNDGLFTFHDILGYLTAYERGCP
ncbi:MAG: S8 family serine peptidase [Phycisphaerales bacterium]|nr:S8 family serine peptidase [Phycisphaerales bacterium]